jgi:hypothetical protein
MIRQTDPVGQPRAGLLTDRPSPPPPAKADPHTFSRVDRARAGQRGDHRWLAPDPQVQSTILVRLSTPLS